MCDLASNPTYTVKAFKNPSNAFSLRLGQWTDDASMGNNLSSRMPNREHDSTIIACFMFNCSVTCFFTCACEPEACMEIEAAETHSSDCRMGYECICGCRPVYC